MNKDLKYIQENFIESRDLCQMVGIIREDLDALIEKELIPNASYTIDLAIRIASPLGDESVVTEVKKYFPKCIIEVIRKNKTAENSKDVKALLKAEFEEAFLNNADKEFAYDNVLNEDGSVDMQKLDLVFEQEWQYHLQGIYGICTLNATGEEIAKKEIAVKKLMDFNQKHQGKVLTDSDKETLKVLNSEFNQVSNLFAPYQRAKSSRGKYLDRILESNGLSELIKDYS